jgi:hypothetical protein
MIAYSKKRTFVLTVGTVFVQVSAAFFAVNEKYALAIVLLLYVALTELSAIRKAVEAKP